MGVKASRTKEITRVILHVTELPEAELPSSTRRSLSRNDSQLLKIKYNILPFHLPAALESPQMLSLFPHPPGDYKEAYLPSLQASPMVKPRTSGC